MTREEAIQELKEDKMLYETDVCHAGDGTPDGRLLEALDMAIEALQTDAVPLEHHRKVLYKTVDQDIEIARLKNRIKELENG